MGAAGVITEGKAVKGSGPFGITVAPTATPGTPWWPRTRSPHCSCA